MTCLNVLKVFALTAKYLKYSLYRNADIVELKKKWAIEIALLFRLDIEEIGAERISVGPCIYIGNHVSYLDIPILVHSVPSVTFVSKREIKSWPVIGTAAVKANTIFVARDNQESKASAKNQIANALIENKQQVAIFPSGTTSIKHSAFWKKGAFEIAEKYRIKVQPFRLKYKPLSRVAYVGDDNFILHMLSLFKIPTIKVVVEFHEPIFIKESLVDCTYWKNWCEDVF